MPHNPPVPRLSIVVPIGRDLAAFESSLISVLENRPAHSEVLVAHDGNYDDPFDLCDEVRFVIADSDCLVDLVTASALAAGGRFVHILSGGMRATLGWADEALSKFEHEDAAVIAPVIRATEGGSIVAAGWQDSAARLCQNAFAGQQHFEPNGPTRIGAYLQASFWRRDVLRSLTTAYLGQVSLEASYAYDQMIRRAGWRCVVARDSEVLCDSYRLPWESNTPQRGMRLRAIRNHFREVTTARSTASSVTSLAANLLRPAGWSESLGQLLAPLLRRTIASKLRPGDVLRHDPDQIIRIDRIAA